MSIKYHTNYMNRYFAYFFLSNQREHFKDPSNRSPWVGPWATRCANKSFNDWEVATDVWPCKVKWFLHRGDVWTFLRFIDLKYDWWSMRYSNKWTASHLGNLAGNKLNWPPHDELIVRLYCSKHQRSVYYKVRPKQLMSIRKNIYIYLILNLFRIIDIT